MPPDEWIPPDLGTHLDNGVKRRMDGRGDAWADQHRLLGKNYSMYDMDAVFGFVAFGQATADRLFLETQPNFSNNTSPFIRRFAFMAMFDRKASEAAAFCHENEYQTAFYLEQCRILSTNQPRPVRFFFCIGGHAPPWRLIEIDINTGDRLGSVILPADGKLWLPIWDALGLTDLRLELRTWINTSEQQK